jgi:hypothetical protein
MQMIGYENHLTKMESFRLQPQKTKLQATKHQSSQFNTIPLISQEIDILVFQFEYT